MNASVSLQATGLADGDAPNTPVTVNGRAATGTWAQNAIGTWTFDGSVPSQDLLLPVLSTAPDAAPTPANNTVALTATQPSQIDWASIDLEGNLPLILVRGVGLLDPTSYVRESSGWDTWKCWTGQALNANDARTCTGGVQNAGWLVDSYFRNITGMPGEANTGSSDADDTDGCGGGNVGASDARALGGAKRGLRHRGRPGRRLRLVRVLQRYGVQQVNVLAYSKGGLMTRALIDGNPSLGNAIKTLVTIDTPNEGSFLADAVQAGLLGGCPFGGAGCAGLLAFEAASGNLTTAAVDADFNASDHNRGCRPRRTMGRPAATPRCGAGYRPG